MIWSRWRWHTYAHTHTQMQMQNTHQQRQPDNGSWKRKRNAKMPVDNIALLCLFALNDFRSEAQRVCIISCCVYLSLRVFGFVLMLLTWKLSIGNVGKNKSDAKKTNTYEFETTSYEINGKPQVITKFSIFTQCLHFKWFFVYVFLDDVSLSFNFEMYWCVWEICQFMPSHFVKMLCHWPNETFSGVTYSKFNNFQQPQHQHKNIAYKFVYV